jgi:hypothetical protein
MKICDKFHGKVKDGTKERKAGTTGKESNRGIFWIFFLNVLYSTLLHLPPLRYHCVGGCWDRTQDFCDSQKRKKVYHRRNPHLDVVCETAQLITLMSAHKTNSTFLRQRRNTKKGEREVYHPVCS